MCRVVFISDINGAVPSLRKGILVSSHMDYLLPHHPSDGKGEGGKAREVEGGTGGGIIKNIYCVSNVY